MVEIKLSGDHPANRIPLGDGRHISENDYIEVDVKHHVVQALLEDGRYETAEELDLPEESEESEDDVEESAEYGYRELQKLAKKYDDVDGNGKKADLREALEQKGEI